MKDKYKDNPSKKENKEDEQNGKSFWAILGIAAVICVVICILGLTASYSYVRCHADSSIPLHEQRGLFGDSWGGVNALISALAFAGVIATLYLQNSDLRLQRKEMAAQRKEFAAENETLRYQRFENLFFNMLNLQQRIVEGLKFNYIEFEDEIIPLATGGTKLNKREINREVVGRDVFRYLFNNVLFLAEVDNNNRKFEGCREYLHDVGFSGYNKIYFPTLFDQYFRHLFQIVEYVEKQGFGFNEAYDYVSLLRSTLSRYEMVWLYYYALQPENRKQKLLVEKYSLLEGIQGGLLSLSVERGNPYFGYAMIEDVMEEDGFAGTDFELYLTDNPEEQDKYHLFAFWSETNMAEGKHYYTRWREYVETKYSDLVRDIMQKISKE